MVPPAGRVGFTLVPSSDSGIRFTNRMDHATAADNQILLNGAGVAAADVDGDGLCDLFFPGLTGEIHLYRNLGGWRFVDITRATGLPARIANAMGAAFADVDGDEDADLLVNAIGGGTRLFRNQGQGTFTEDLDAGLRPEGGSHSLALADIDGDGDLDLYVANYRTTTVRDHPIRIRLRNVNGQFVVPSPYEDRFLVKITAPGQGSLVELGEPDVLYLNDGRGHFQPMSWTEGRFLDEDGRPLEAPPRDWSLSAMLRDLNHDGLPDLFVCSDFSTPDRFWLNQGGGRFRALPRLALRHTSWSSMTLDVADINHDGLDDLFVADMLSPDHSRRQLQRGNAHPTVLDDDLRNDRPQRMRNHLFLQRPDHTFTEIAYQAGIEASEWTWGALFLDVDLDGYEDLLLANGHVYDMQDSDAIARLRQMSAAGPQTGVQALTNYPPLNTANLAFRNLGHGRFEPANHWGFELEGVSQGLILADLDQDGDADVVVSNLNQPPFLLRNECPAPRLRVQLRGLPPNTAGIGARITLRTPGFCQSQIITGGGRYLSSDEPARTFAAVGLPSPKAVLEVAWPDGQRSSLTNPLPNSLYSFSQADAHKLPPPAPSPLPRPQFAEFTPSLGHRHVDPPYDDFSRQKLMSRKLSQLGPGVAWLDYDQDGWEDLVIGGGASSGPTLLQNVEGKQFRAVSLPAPPLAEVGDQTGLAAWQTAGGKTHLLVGFSNYELGAGSASQVIEYTFAHGQCTEPAGIWSGPQAIGPIALGDLDGDGDLDLFVGGRVAPGRYPEDVASCLLLQDSGRFTPATDVPPQFHELGLVTSAVWSDWDGDGFPELAVATEWGPIRVFWNQQGRLTDKTHELGLEAFPGWWNSLATADLDGDGAMELVAGNWGRNHHFQRYARDGIRIYFGEFSADGAFEGLEAYRPPGETEYFPWRDYGTFSQAIPSVAERFHSYREFSRASLKPILDSQYPRARYKTATTFEHSWFQLVEGRMLRHDLPAESQVTPAFGVVPGDFDADGHLDLFLAQNFFGVEPDTTRYDGGRGLLLRGNGHGQLDPVEGERSGVLVYGEQRGAAAADFDHDGRLDLLVGVNAEATRLYRNQSERRGFRVRLVGPSGNRSALGASVRPIQAGQPGPRQEVQGGGGYASQSGAALVLGGTEAPTALQVLWPGGRVQTVPWPSATNELVVPYPP